MADTRTPGGHPAGGSPRACNFCGKPRSAVACLVSGPTVAICDECVGLCNDIIAEEIDREDQRAAPKARALAPLRQALPVLESLGVPAGLLAELRDTLSAVEQSEPPSTAGAS
ncbi:MAG: hypothetical protein JST54_23980 [Deltaproteobacteria bacterium]|nr:hypothetical protein [Deltaproteobacteria bacterium]